VGSSSYDDRTSARNLAHIVWPKPETGIDETREPVRLRRAGLPAERFGREIDDPLHLIRVIPAQEAVWRVLVQFLRGVE